MNCVASVKIGQHGTNGGGGVFISVNSRNYFEAHMFKTIQILALCAGVTALSPPALAQTTPANPPTSAGEGGAAVPQGKTSDRTPNDPSPDRTPNATSAGETGTDKAKTPEGTSDRTPKENPPASDDAD
jgi:hypothetical protein